MHAENCHGYVIGADCSLKEGALSGRWDKGENGCVDCGSVVQLGRSLHGWRWHGCTAAVPGQLWCRSCGGIASSALHFMRRAGPISCLRFTAIARAANQRGTARHRSHRGAFRLSHAQRGTARHRQSPSLALFAFARPGVNRQRSLYWVAHAPAATTTATAAHAHFVSKLNRSCGSYSNDSNIRLGSRYGSPRSWCVV